MINVNNLSASFKDKTVFDQLSFTIEQGTFTSIYGPSGSGKTTLLNTLGLIEPVQKGKLLIAGNPAPKPHSKEALLFRRSNMSYLFQNFGLMDEATIDQNLEISLFYSSLSKKEKVFKKKEAMERAHLNMSLSKKVYQLSGGEKQRVALARAILKPSQLIFADEPTGSLDNDNKQEVLSILKSEQALGKTIVIVSHDLDLIAASDHKIFID